MQSALKGLKKILLHATKVLRQRLKDLCRSLYLPNTSQDPDHHAKHGIALIVYQIIQWQLTLVLKSKRRQLFSNHTALPICHPQIKHYWLTMAPYQRS